MALLTSGRKPKQCRHGLFTDVQDNVISELTFTVLKVERASTTTKPPPASSAALFRPAAF